MTTDLLQQGIAQMMHDELERRRLDVYLVPCFGHLSDTGRQRRIVMDQNPRWYQSFCANYPSTRRRPRRRRVPDTAIKRQDTLRALREIAVGQVKTEYARRLVPIVAEETERFIQMEKTGQIEAWLQ